MSDKIYLGRRMMDFSAVPSFQPYSRVTLWYDDENAFTAGDDTGRTLEADCPWATQQMCDDILAAIQGFSYSPFEAQDALLDPAAELGDGVTANGVYGPLAAMETTFDAMCAANISAPTDDEVDHEYPYLSPQQRQLKRTVKLGQDYYGTRITRAAGLEIVKTGADGTEKSRVKLNSDVLAFYNDDGGEALYFDPASGKYKFTGAVEIREGSININDAFVVDALGNVTIGGNMVFTGASSFVQTRYSTDKDAAVPDGWQENWSSAWDNTSTQVWVIYSYNAGATWTAPMLAQGKDGDRGPAGSSASVTFDNILRALQRAESVESTFITADSAGAPNIYGGNIYGARIYAGSSSGYFTAMDSGGLRVYAGSSTPKFLIGWEEVETISYPYILIGAGNPGASTSPGMIKKYGRGLWIGDDEDYSATSQVPGNGNQTGIFIDFSQGTITKYEDGVASEIGSGDGGGGTAVFG